MGSSHPFRFGIFLHNTNPSVEALAEQARRAEALGYATVLVPDHLGDAFAPSLALSIIAHATTTIRLGSFVYSNDFRHPTLLAKEVAALDVLSQGRLEWGMGAGWMEEEYTQIGLPFRAPAERIGRLKEGLALMKSCLSQPMVDHQGTHYRVQNFSPALFPVQKPYPPLYMGGSGKQMLTLAARTAQIVGIVPRIQRPERGTHMNDVLDLNDAFAEATREKIRWIRAAASDRFEDLELNLVLLDALISPQSVSKSQEQLAQRLGGTALPLEQCPFVLFGPPSLICERLLQLRANYGISYITLWEEHLEAFAPIVAQLAGK